MVLVVGEALRAPTRAGDDVGADRGRNRQVRPHGADAEGLRHDRTDRGEERETLRRELERRLRQATLEADRLAGRVACEET